MKDDVYQAMLLDLEAAMGIKQNEDSIKLLMLELGYCYSCPFVDDCASGCVNVGRPSGVSGRSSEADIGAKTKTKNQETKNNE